MWVNALNHTGLKDTQTNVWDENSLTFTNWLTSLLELQPATVSSILKIIFIVSVIIETISFILSSNNNYMM